MAYRILLVEDEPLIQGLYVMVLKMARHMVSAATEEQQALQLFKEQAPDLVLLDLMIPTERPNAQANDFHEPIGYQVLKSIRQQAGAPVKIVILSNLDSDEHRRRAAELGANDYWVKASLDPHELPVRVDSIMERT